MHSIHINLITQNCPTSSRSLTRHFQSILRINLTKELVLLFIVNTTENHRTHDQGSTAPRGSQT